MPWPYSRVLSTPPPHPTLPPNPYTGNAGYVLQQTRQNPKYPVQEGAAEANDQAAKANGLWPSGQQLLPGSGLSVPAEQRPC